MADTLEHCSLLPFPVTIEQITRDWLTTALRVRHPGVTVRDFAIEDMIRGTCTKARLRLDMDEAGRRAGIPETVFLKGGFEEHSRELNFVLMTEARGYRDLLSGGTLNAPTCYFADYDEERLQGIIIMEDLGTRGATYGNALRPRAHADVVQTVGLLAEYHSRTWNCAPFTPGERLGWVETQPPFSRPVMQAYFEPESWNRYVQLPRAAAASSQFLDRDWALDALARMKRLSDDVPNCIIHGDSHLGNVFFQPDGKPGFYDIVPRRAPAMAEVAYHITMALDVADRGRSQGALVQHYLDELQRNGVTDAPTFADAMRQFGAFLIEPFCLVLLNDPYFMPETPTTANAARLSAAMVENDTPRLLREMT